jgi:tetratricopeptide (TPR) repeat protein
MTPRVALLLVALTLPAQAAKNSSGEQREAFRLWDAGVRLILQDKKPEARAKWQECLKLNPDNKDCRAGLKLLGPSVPQGSRTVPSGQTAAMPQMQSIEAGASARAEWSRGLIYFQKTDYARAKEAWSSCLRLDPGNSDCQIGLDRLARLSRSGASAPTVPDPRAAIRHWHTGIIYFQKQNYAKAREEWKECRALDPGNDDCATGLRRLDSTYNP